MPWKALFLLARRTCAEMANVESHRSAAEPGRGLSDECVSSFECNICYEIAREPVVTVCGHLYCWPCIYRCPLPALPVLIPHVARRRGSVVNMGFSSTSSE